MCASISFLGCIPKKHAIGLIFSGTIFLLPFAGLQVYLGGPWDIKLINAGEISAAAGGLVIWPAKMLVFLGFALLLAQGVSEITKRIAVIGGLIPEPNAEQELPPAVSEMEIGAGFNISQGNGRDR